MLRRILAAATLAGLAGLGLAVPAEADPGTGTLTVTGDAGDYLTQGVGHAYSSPADAVDLTGDLHHVAVGVSGDDGDWWTIDVAAPPGEVLTAGTTYAATRYPFNDGAGFDLAGNGRGCDTSSSIVTVEAIGVDDVGAVTRLAATFEQRCDAGAAAARGHVDVTLAPAQPPLQVRLTTTGATLGSSGGVVVAGTLTCSSDTTAYVRVVVTQIVGQTLLDGTGSTYVDCRAGRTAGWAGFAYDTAGPFLAGDAVVASTVSAGDAATGEQARASDTDTLRLGVPPTS